MTILQKLRDVHDRYGVRGRQQFGHADHEVRHTEAWEHETFAEEQARWERGDREYARICEEVRSAEGDEASLRADDAKADWDVCAAPQRQADDQAERVRHVNLPVTGLEPEPVGILSNPR
jgi:hypothetical protein